MSTDILSSTLSSLAKVLEGTFFPTAIFSVENGVLTLLATSNLGNATNQDELPKQFTVKPKQLKKVLEQGEKIFNVSSDTTALPELIEFASHLKLDKVAFLPVSGEASIQGLVLVGNYAGQSLTKKTLGPLIELSQLARTIIEQTALSKQAEKRIAEAESLTTITNAIKTPWDTIAFFETLHEQVKQTIGDYAFVGALYDEKTDSINIPYLYEEGIVRNGILRSHTDHGKGDQGGHRAGCGGPRDRPRRHAGRDVEGGDRIQLRGARSRHSAGFRHLIGPRRSDPARGARRPADYLLHSAWRNGAREEPQIRS